MTKPELTEAELDEMEERQRHARKLLNSPYLILQAVVVDDIPKLIAEVRRLRGLVGDLELQAKECARREFVEATDRAKGWSLAEAWKAVAELALASPSLYTYDNIVWNRFRAAFRAARALEENE